jgi:Skp family chaperone for outer membrane proteins
MNKLNLTAVLVILSFTIQAQVGVIDSKKIFASMPILAKLDTMVVIEQMKYQKEFESKNAKFQEALQIADSFYKKTPKGATTKILVENAQRMNDELKEFEKTATGKIQEYKAKLFQPYYEKINVAVKAVAIKKGIKQVMDAQVSNFVYVDESSDMTNEVINSIKP